MTDKSGSAVADSFSLLILKGADAGKAIDLKVNREYVIGRSEECDIRIDPSDKMVSRRHVLLKVESDKVVLENLSRTNPVQVRGKTVTSTMLKPKDKFQVGGTVFALKAPEGTGTSLPFKPDRKILLLAGLLALCLLLLVVVFTEKEEAPVQPLTVAGPDAGRRDMTAQAPPAGASSSSLPHLSGMTVSDRDRELADQHFRQGLFFYDTGNILRAVGEWERAVSFNPEHADARLWFLKAERELEELVKNHYQNAMLHYKYMRYNQAEYEFKMVAELSRNKNSDQYISALRYLDELRSK